MYIKVQNTQRLNLKQGAIGLRGQQGRIKRTDGDRGGQVLHTGSHWPEDAAGIHRETQEAREREYRQAQMAIQGALCKLQLGGWGMGVLGT